MHPIKQCLRIAALAAVAMAYVHVAGAQSLGAVAEKEEARRKRVAGRGKIYTNESLKAGGEAPPPAESRPPAAAAQKPAQEAPKTDSEPDRKKDEAHWRGRITKARQGLDRARMFREALQTRINSLTADFTARDDPAQRAVLANDRQKALAELERVSAEITALEKEIRDIEEEARKAGIPPGWLR